MNCRDDSPGAMGAPDSFPVVGHEEQKNGLTYMELEAQIRIRISEGAERENETEGKFEDYSQDIRK